MPLNTGRIFLAVSVTGCVAMFVACCCFPDPTNKGGLPPMAPTGPALSVELHDSYESIVAKIGPPTSVDTTENDRPKPFFITKLADYQPEGVRLFFVLDKSNNTWLFRNVAEIATGDQITLEDAIERLRGRVGRQPLPVVSQQKELPKPPPAEATKSVPPKPVTDSQDEKAIRAKLKELEVEISRIADEIDALRRSEKQLPFLDTTNLRVGQVGIVADKERFSVWRVVNGSTAVVTPFDGSNQQLFDKRFIISGISTAGIVDDATVKMLGVFEVAGTQKDPLGSTRFLVRKLSLAESKKLLADSIQIDELNKLRLVKSDEHKVFKSKLAALEPSTATRKVTQAEFGAAWPFTVSEGTLECRNGAVLFHTLYSTYAINTVAENLPDTRKVATIQRIDAKTRKKMSYANILNLGESLCK